MESEDELVARMRSVNARVHPLNACWTGIEQALSFYLTARQGLEAVAAKQFGGQGHLELSDQESSAVAAQEIDTGLQTLNTQFLIRLCSVLEVLCHDFVAASIKHDPKLISKPPLARVKVTIPEVLALSEDERADLFATQLLDELGGPQKLGIDKFHESFEFAGFKFSVKREWRRPLREMYAVRNAMLHRGGIADRRFLSACPWLSYPLGETIRVTPLQIGRYFEATRAYVIALVTAAYELFQPTIDEANEVTERKRREKEADAQRRREYEASRKPTPDEEEFESDT